MRPIVRSIVRSLLNILLMVPLLMVCLAFGWIWMVQRDRLPMPPGRPYGIIEDSKMLTPGTIVTSLTAQYVPSRIVWWNFRIFAVPLLLPEEVQVTMRYQRPGEPEKSWDHTYLWACFADDPRKCLTLYEVIGIQVCGKGIDADGRGGPCRYVYLRGQLIPSFHAPACS
jgi:hypothetical protein